VISDLVHQGDVPSVDLRSMRVAGTGAGALDPICVRIDLLEEVRMLRLALRRLAEDADLRLTLGRAARQYWERLGTLGLMARDYEALLEETRAAPAPARPSRWPVHLAADGSAAARALVSQVGVPWPFDSTAPRVEPARHQAMPDGQ